MYNYQKKTLMLMALSAAWSGMMEPGYTNQSFKQIESKPPQISSEYVERVKQEIRAEHAQKRKKKRKK